MSIRDYTKYIKGDHYLISFFCATTSILATSRYRYCNSKKAKKLPVKGVFLMIRLMLCEVN